ncbi:MAG: 6-pyruvoyl tetrahydropterin reductase [Gammaproteobacteria bacterium]|nr:MAG: 6-pyruvoyl tetrahydropterin reductase [Gammaproteobacteria bacterium]
MPILFVEHLTTIDCALFDPRRGLVGATWIVDLQMSGELDEQGMVLDFGRVKSEVRQAIESRVDHCLLVPEQAPEISIRQESGLLEVRMESDVGPIRHRGPGQSCSLIEAPRIDRASVTRACLGAAREVLPDNVGELELNLRCEQGEGPFFRYCHGLRRHAGNCQRIAHGHRSRLEIWIGGGRDPELEREWAERWRDIYLGTREHLLQRFDAGGTECLRFGYRALQGEFLLELPAARCYLLDGASTIERIALHLAGECARRFPGDAIQARVWEGVNKGAIACSGV